ncbi:MAG: hypothetical protein EOP88_24320 [Verrucomicrobiaceae bacterium]|nr:MAG: hypothetical protein EOP88_24320 [Verrucomicrobiaceae bacterium]
MKNAPVMDFWVSTSIFLAAQANTPAAPQGRLLHEMVTRRDTSAAPEKKFEVRHPAVKGRSLHAG